MCSLLGQPCSEAVSVVEPGGVKLQFASVDFTDKQPLREADGDIAAGLEKLTTDGGSNNFLIVSAGSYYVPEPRVIAMLSGPLTRSSLAGIGAFLSLFGLAFLAPALWMAREHQRIVTRWPEAQATATSSGVVQYTERGRTYHRAEYELRYIVNGREYVTPESSSSSHSSHDTAARQAEHYGPGTRHRVRYNPDNPHDIRLHAGYSARFFLLPLLFGGVGALMELLGLWVLMKAWRASPGLRCPSCKAAIDEPDSYCASCGTRVAPGEAPPSRSREDDDLAVRTAAYNRRGNLIGGSIFGVIGLALLIAAGIIAARRHTIIRSWPETQALVTRSQVSRGHSREGRPAFRPAIDFKYTLGGRQYTTTASADQASSYAWAAAQVDRHTPGGRRTIRYNPANPTDVRLDVGYTFEYFAIALVLGLLGGIFTPLGFALLYSAVRTTHKSCLSCGMRLPLNAKFCSNCGVPA